MDFGQLVSNGLQDDILRLDENSLHTKYKFGVLLVKEGQTREEEWFSNNHDSSEPFEEFLSILGQKVSLYGYTGWAAGLDTKSGDSGDYTYINYWKRQDENDMQQLAFHVSTLIPSRSGDKQQIQRKRHIGNDIVCLVFVEGQQPFNPAAIKSQFLHVFIIVHLEEIATTSHVDGKGKIQNRQIAKAWRVEVVSAENVPSFGPPLPEGALFFDKKELQDFLIAKLVNAEYAAFKSPKFYVPMSRAREGIFTNLVEKGYKLATAPSDGPTAATYSHNDNYPLTTTLSSTASSFSSIASTTTNTMTDKNSFHSFQHKHSKSSSSAITTLSQHSHKNQLPTVEEFDAIVNNYLENLSTKKRDKALVDKYRYSLILQVLKDPRNTAISTAQFRFWVKKMFRLSKKTSSIAEYTVCHDNKPVATREEIYDILVHAHKEAHHGGRDKTSALVRKRYSWIPKELIARFVRHCPFCISRRNG
ncbi:hypothetical protein BDF20DRAFT_797071, partial [Mycotypha africana]|uniref:uncharacterized protein n=1 Tax=Mycotypha africana TaxID=64632 RepID=UPI0022FFFE73